MAAKPSSSATAKALRKIQEQITCGVCLDAYKKPKLLKCFHVYCEHCLTRLVHGGPQERSISCPQCRQETALTAGGISDLQGAFYVHYLFEIQDTLQKVSSSDKPTCSKCKRRESSQFCRSCGFVCQRCVETHQEWEEFASHEIIGLQTLAGDVTTLVSPLNKKLLCSKHPGKEADLYCEKCEELICRDCIVRVHREHQYDLVTESFSRHEKELSNSLQPLVKQLTSLNRAIESLDTRCAEVNEQKTAVVDKVRSIMAEIREALEVRERELVDRAEQTAGEKLRVLAAQRSELQLQASKHGKCRDFFEEMRQTCSQGEFLRMKSPLIKQIGQLTESFEPESLRLSEQADMKFNCNLDELIGTCQQFGEVYCQPVCPGKCRASGEGVRVAMRGQTASVSVEALDREGEACLAPVNSLTCELVSSDGRSQVSGTTEGNNDNYYITYVPQVVGRHQLHISIENCPISNSPFTVNVLPDFAAPSRIIGDLNRPWGLAVREGCGGEEVVVAERGAHCVSIINVASGEKKSFGSLGSSLGAFNHPEGVAVDAQGNILVGDCKNHRIQQFMPNGENLEIVGGMVGRPLQFYLPLGIAVHPHSQKVYVADRGNHRIQVLHSDSTYCGHFGSAGSGNGQFQYPYDIATDSDGNVYVVDCGNNRVQVFTADGVYLRQFGRLQEGEDDGRGGKGGGEREVGSEREDAKENMDSQEEGGADIESVSEESEVLMDVILEECKAAAAEMEGASKESEVMMAEIESTRKKYEAVNAAIESGTSKEFEMVKAEIEITSKKCEVLKTKIESVNKRLNVVVTAFIEATAEIVDEGEDEESKGECEGELEGEREDEGEGELEGEREGEGDEGQLEGEREGEGKGEGEGSEGELEGEREELEGEREGEGEGEWECEGEEEGRREEGHLYQPAGIAIDSQTNVVYVTERGNNRVMIFSSDGECIKSFGGKGATPGQFDRPHGITVDTNGTVFVSDAFNNRIQIFS